MFNLWDCYGASGLIFLSIGLCQIVPLIYVHGVGKYKEAIHEMLGFRSVIVEWFNFCWTVVSPLIISVSHIPLSLVCVQLDFFQTILLFAIYQKLVEPSEFKHETYVYPVWSQVLGWCFILLALIWIPLYAIYHLITTTVTTSSVPFTSDDDKKADHATKC